MTSQCPRCSAPRVGDSPFCQNCGFDFRFAPVPAASPQPPAPQPPAPQAPSYGAVPQPPAGQAPSYGEAPQPGMQYGQPPAQGAQGYGYQPAPTAPAYGQPAQPGPAPTTCMRCRAPLYPGYTQCGNCGFDNRAPWSGPAPAAPVTPTAPARRSVLPIALVVGGVALLAVAGYVLAFGPKATSNASSSPRASASSSDVALASPTLTPLITPEPVESASEAPSGGAATPEPSPDSVWTNFTSPDGKWSVMFPGTMTPVKQTQALDVGTTSGEMSMWMVADGADVYAVADFDFTAGTIGSNSSIYLEATATAMAGSFGGTVVSQTDSTVGGYSAKDIVLEKAGQTISLRLWFVGDRFYMLMVEGGDGDTVYPQHFMATFALK